MAISSSVRHGDPIADIRQSPLPGSDLQAFATRQFQEFLDDLENLFIDTDVSKFNQKLAILQSQIASKVGVVSKTHDIDIGRINQLLQIDRLRTSAASISNRVTGLESKSVPVTADHTTNGNEILTLNNTVDVTVTLNTAPKDQETVEFLKKVHPLTNIVGLISGITPNILVFKGDSLKIRYTNDAGEWSPI